MKAKSQRPSRRRMERVVYCGNVFGMSIWFDDENERVDKDRIHAQKVGRNMETVKRFIFMMVEYGGGIVFRLFEGNESENTRVDEDHGPENQLERKLGVFVADDDLRNHGSWPAAQQFADVERRFRNTPL